MLNDLHNHSSYRVAYEKFTRIFLDSFCDYRRNNYATENAVFCARREVEKEMFKLIRDNNKNVKMVVIAYNQLLNDADLVEKAINYYRGMEKTK
jgi:hypothetical protein